jgi:hypothetical protein
MLGDRDARKHAEATVRRRGRALLGCMDSSSPGAVLLLGVASRAAALAIEDVP